MYGDLFNRSRKLLPGFVASLLLVLAIKTAAFIPIEQAIYRFYFLLRGQQPWDPRIVVVTIDDESIALLGRFPWSREYYAELLHRFVAAKPNVVVLNLLFSESSAADPQLRQAIQDHGQVILAEAWDAQGNLLEPVPSLANAAKGLGHVMKITDADGWVREVQPWIKGHPTLGLAAFNLYKQSDRQQADRQVNQHQNHQNIVSNIVSNPAISPQTLGINWPGAADQVAHYSFASVLQGQIPNSAFANKIILVGATAATLDPLIMPYPSAAQGGVYLHAAVIDDLLRQGFLQRWGWAALPYGVFLAPLLGFWLLRRSVWEQFSVSIVLMGGWFGVGWLAFWGGYWIPIATPIALIGSTALLVLCADRLREHRLLKAEIVERRRIEAELRHRMNHDALTGLLSRQGFLQYLENTLGESNFAVCFLDLDRFKSVNDTFGHWVGDQLLQQVGQRLQSVLDHQNFPYFLSRFGGDEFGFLLKEYSEISTIVAIVEDIRSQLLQPVLINNQMLFVDSSIGIILVDSQSTQNCETILRDVDIAMYAAKSKRTGHEIFKPEMRETVEHSLSLEMELRQAVITDTFDIYYQPIVHLNTGTIAGFEALIRWFHPHQGTISPLRFIPVAEDTGLILQIGEWVFLESCQRLKSWQDSGLIAPDTFVSVNLSAKQFSETRLLQYIDQVLAKTGLSPHNLKIEITESILVTNQELAEYMIDELRNRQIRISLDDFGTGYSALGYLKQFPVDMLKIDRSFIEEINTNPKALGIIKSIITLANSFDIPVICEGIETPEQEQQLRHLQCQFGQGFLFMKPLPPEELEPYLHNWKVLTPLTLATRIGNKSQPKGKLQEGQIN